MHVPHQNAVGNGVFGHSAKSRINIWLIKITKYLLTQKPRTMTANFCRKIEIEKTVAENLQFLINYYRNNIVFLDTCTPI